MGYLEYIFIIWILLVAFVVWAYRRGSTFHIYQIVVMSIKQITEERFGAKPLKARLETFLEGKEMPPNPPEPTIDDYVKRCQENGIEQYLKLDKNGKIRLMKIMLELLKGKKV